MNLSDQELARKKHADQSTAWRKRNSITLHLGAQGITAWMDAPDAQDAKPVLSNSVISDFSQTLENHISSCTAGAAWRPSFNSAPGQEIQFLENCLSSSDRRSRCQYLRNRYRRWRQSLPGGACTTTIIHAGLSTEK